MEFLQKLGKSLMLPVACMPLCGLLMGIGYLLCPASMQGGAVAGAIPVAGQFLVRAGSVVIDQIPILFAVGTGVGMCRDGDGTAALAALVSWFMIGGLLHPDFVSLLTGSLENRPETLLAFQKVSNPFIGIIAGLIAAFCYDRFRNAQMPRWLSFFSGKRCVAIVSGMVSILASALLILVWPLLFGLLIRFGNAIADLGPLGAAVYASANRLLIPTGLHHALNNVFWFDTIGLGDLVSFWAGKTSADVSWSLGIYMSGFFPCMMFGVPGAALAIWQCSEDRRRGAVAGIMLSSALCAFVCGITEPFEFAFMFTSPLLYLVYSVLYGIFTYAAAVTGFRAGFSFSAGAADLFFSSSLPAAQRTWLILPLGLAAFAVFYLTFRFMIQRFDLKTPGRGDALPEENGKAKSPKDGRPDYEGMAEEILAGLGGPENVISAGHCATRLRAEVRDPSLADDAAIRRSGALGVIRVGKNGLQVIIGTQVQFVSDALNDFLSKDRD